MPNFSPSTIQLWTTRNFSFYARFSPHGIKIAKKTLHYTNRYFRRLIKEFAVIFPLVLLAALAINLIQPKSRFQFLKDQVLAHPASSASHYNLAKQFYLLNDFSLSQKELNAAIKSSKNVEEKNRLTLLRDTINNLENQPLKTQNSILSWQKIINQYPSYRDAYVKLAILSWDLYRPFDSQKFMEKTLQIDPNNSQLLKYLHSLN